MKKLFFYYVAGLGSLTLILIVLPYLISSKDQTEFAVGVIALSVLGFIVFGCLEKISRGKRR